MGNTMNYDFKEHKHRYSVWTSARAVQRSFTTTSKISSAIDATSLRNFSETINHLDQKTFDDQHKEWCNTIIAHFKKEDIICSYGRAAKIIAIYLKTSLIMTANGESDIHRLIHPPIDSILLISLSNSNDLKDLKTKRWTNFNQEDYWNLVERIREYFKSFDWTLEAHWKPERDI